eukprot:g5297.t1
MSEPNRNSSSSSAPLLSRMGPDHGTTRKFDPKEKDLPKWARGLNHRVLGCVLLGITALTLAIVIVLAKSFGKQQYEIATRPGNFGYSGEFSEKREELLDKIQPQPENLSTEFEAMSLKSVYAQSKADPLAEREVLQNPVNVEKKKENSGNSPHRAYDESNTSSARFLNRETEVSELLGGGSIRKPKRDAREYGHMTLENGLHVLVISDPLTPKAAASMSVKVGSLSDPEDIPGLAHFLEHMLFMGSKKYPDEDGFSTLLSQFGGSSNAFTASEETNFFFDIEAEHLVEVLEVWSHFFIDPLLSESGTDRELHAVHSEHTKNENNDSWRVEQLLRTTSSSAHPFHKFGTGNLDTLKTGPKAMGVDVRMELLRFYTTHYSANLMRLCIAGKESVEELKMIAKEKFFKVPNYNRKPFYFDPAPLREPDQLGMRYSIKPQKDNYSIEAKWLLPSMRAHYRTKPLEYISNIIGSEGPNSLLSVLKDKRWANNLSAGTSDEGPDYSWFSVTIELNRNGIQKVDAILALLYETIELIRQEGPQEWRWNESAKIAQNEFDYSEKIDTSNYVTALSTAMHYYPVEEIITGGFLYEEWDENPIRLVLSQLVPSRMVVIILNADLDQGPSANLPLIEHWYRTPYHEEPLSRRPGLLEKLSNPVPQSHMIKLPDINTYIVQDFTLAGPVANNGGTDESPVEQPKDCKDKNCWPILATNSKCLRVWIRPDLYFRDPRIAIVVGIDISKKIKEDVGGRRFALLKHVYSSALDDKLREQTYQAMLAGYKYSFSSTTTGFQLIVEGFSEKISGFLQHILDYIVSFEPDKTRFPAILEEFVRGLKNFKNKLPVRHAAFYSAYATTSPSFTKQDLLDELVLAAKDRKGDDQYKVTTSEVKAVAGEFFENIQTEILIHGNVDQQVGQQLSEIIQSKFKTGKECFRNNLMDRKLPVGHDGTFIQFTGENAEIEVNSAVVNDYQIGQRTTKLDVQMELLVDILSTPLFDELRTKQQLGYIVGCTSSTSKDLMSLQAYVQSPNVSPDELDRKIEEFFITFKETLRKFPEKDLKSRIDSLVKLKNAPLPNPKSEVDILWSEISDQEYQFDRRFEEADAMREVTNAQLYFLLEERIIGPKRQKLSTQMFGKGKELPSAGASSSVVAQDISSLQKMKNVWEMYPIKPPKIDLSPKVQSKEEKALEMQKKIATVLEQRLRRR